MQWYKNYNSLPRNARVIVENKVAYFYVPNVCEQLDLNVIQTLQFLSHLLKKFTKCDFQNRTKNEYQQNYNSRI